MLKLSVVMSCWNKEHIVEKVIISIENQTVKPHELLFIDDNSDDNSLEIVKNLRDQMSFPIRIFETHKSLTHNLCLPCNIGFKRAEGDILMILDADTCSVNRTNFEQIIQQHQVNKKILLTPKLLIGTIPREPTIDSNKLKTMQDSGVRISADGSSTRKEHIHKIKGYDERMYGWGANHPDIVARLGMIGVKALRDEAVIFQHQGGRALKRKHNPKNDSIHMSNVRNHVYCPNEEWGEHPLLELVEGD